MNIGESRYAASDQMVSGKGNFASFESRHRSYRLADLDAVILSRRTRQTRAALIRILKIAITVTTAAGALFVIGIVLDALEFGAGFVPVSPKWGLWISIGFLVTSLTLAVIGAVRTFKVSRTELTGGMVNLKVLQDIAAELTHKRMVYPGNDQISFGLGEEGIQIRGRKRLLQFEWKGFDFNALAAVNPGIDAILTSEAPPAYPFSKVEAGEHDDTSLDEFLSAIKVWAEQRDPKNPNQLKHSSLRLPLLVSSESLEAARVEEEGVQRDRVYREAIAKGVREDRARKESAAVKVKLESVAWQEYIHIPAHFFMDGDDIGDWPDAVALILYMLHRRAPRTIE